VDHTVVNSALYVGHVGHRRVEPAHKFRYRTVKCLLDLDELEDVMARHPLWSTRRGRPVQFRRSDYLDQPDVDLKVVAQQRVAESLGVPVDGTVLLFTQLRTWGWCFNPISLFYCLDHQDHLRAVVASVTNTPWGERHDYVLAAEEDGVKACLPKALHVSPFIAMDCTYRFAFSAPRERLAARIEVLEGNEVRLRTALEVTRRPLDRTAMSRLAASTSFLAWRTSVSIYVQAARLGRKGASFHAHPHRLAASSETRS
jgi:uncharacterized protein